MSQPPQPGPTPDQMAQLQHQLDAARAQVARVQAELSAGGPAPAPSAAPVITVNGQTIPLGDGHQVPTIVDALRAAHAGTTGTTPMVFVGGQQVGAGQPFSLAQYLDPSQLTQVQSALGQLMSTHPEYAQHFSGLLGAGAAGSGTEGPYGAPTPAPGGADGWGGGASAYPSPMSVTTLADPPRPVPLAYRIATFNLSLLELFVLVMGVTAPIALWILLPGAAPVGLLVASVLVLAYRAHLYVGRVGMLRWGRVVTVTGVELLGSGTYYSGATYQNMRMRQAHGWQATTEFYSGPGYRNKVSYELDGTRADVVMHGRDYAGGVVLADSRKPARAMCVSAFPYDVEPTADGQWPGRLTAWLWVGIVFTVAFELALLGLTGYVARSTWGG